MWRKSPGRESPHQEVDHGASNPSHAAPGIRLGFLAEPPLAPEQGERTLEGSPTGQHDETAMPLELMHALEPELEPLCGPIFQGLLVGSVRPDGLAPGGAVPVERDEHRLGSAALLHACPMHAQRVDQAEGTDRKMALRPRTFFAPSWPLGCSFPSFPPIGRPKRRRSAWALGPLHGGLPLGAHGGRVQRAVLPTAANVEPDHAPGRNIMREHAPGAAHARLVEAGVPDLAQRILARPARSAVLGWGQRRPDPVPRQIGKVDRIRSASNARPRTPTPCQFLHTPSGAMVSTL